MKKLILFMIMIGSLSINYGLYASETSEEDLSELEKLLEQDLSSILEYDINCSDDLEKLIQNVVDDYSNDEVKSQIIETLNSTEMEDISIEKIGDFLFKYKETLETFEGYINETNTTSEDTQ